MPADLISSVHLILSMHAEERKGLRDRLLRSDRERYDQALTAVVADVGCGGKAHLTDPAEMKKLAGRAKEVSEGVADTFNDDLLRALEGFEKQWVDLHGSRKGMNRLWLAKRAQEWEGERAIWKGAQIAITENTWTVDRAKEAFVKRNALDGRARVLPEAAVCDICKGYVAMGWVALQEADRVFEIPNHVNCIHFIQLDADKGSVPPCDELWAGGTP